jgi:hypothetical protein
MIERGAAIAVMVGVFLSIGTTAASGQWNNPDYVPPIIPVGREMAWVEPVAWQDSVQNPVQNPIQDPLQNQPAPIPQDNALRRPAGPSNQFATRSANRTLGGAGGPGPKSTYMMGDFFFSNGQLFRRNDQGAPGNNIIAELPASGGTRRVKISENNSPIPRDRLFFTYNHFHNAVRVRSATPFDMNVDKYTPGIEKTLWDGLASVELRTPIATAQNPDVDIFATGPDRESIFGNMNVTTKLLLWQDELDAVAIGLGINLPTGPDSRIFPGQVPDPILTINNDSVHLLPYLGFLRTPNDRVFIHGYVQVDVDANGNEVLDGFGNSAGVLNDQTLLYADLGMGFWLYRAPHNRIVTGVVPTIEVHYTTSLQDADIVRGGILGPVGLGNTFNRVDVANATLGTQFHLSSGSTMSVGCALPLSRAESDRQFDAEAIFQFNRFY